MIIDLSTTIEAKSDQLNADDLLSGPRILKITKVVKKDSKEQPAWIYYEGDKGKPWKPNLGMRRLLITIWGADGAAYVGRSVEVFTEPKVKWSGEEVGGIRVSRLSNITNTIAFALTISRGKKTTIMIKPLEIQKEPTIEERRNKMVEAIKKEGILVTPEIEKSVSDCATYEQLKQVYNSIKLNNQQVKP
jgi:hypothetical protein